MSNPLRRRPWTLLTVTSFSLALLACGPLDSLMGGGSKVAEEAKSALNKGEMDAASSKFEEALKAAPTSVDAAVGAAYMRSLKGDLDGADAALAGAEAAAGEKAGEIKLRRALIAMQKGDLDKVKELGNGSGLPAGKLLAAEAELADGNREQAKAILEGISADAGSVGATAKQYLALMADPNPLVAGLSETQALWALGQQKVAVRSVEELVKAYAESHEDGPEQILLWAGRAAALGEAEVAWRLLDAISVPPENQAWRVMATKGIAWCADGNAGECIKTFEQVKVMAPADGYVDARVTAANVIAGRDPATARQLLEGLQGDGAARVFLLLGDKQAAASVAADPFLKKQLGG